MNATDVVVVSYNSGGELRACVEPLAGEPDVRVILVDNASSDDSLVVVADLPVELVPLDHNGGFARGSNVGWRRGERSLRAVPEPRRSDRPRLPRPSGDAPRRGTSGRCCCAQDPGRRRQARLLAASISASPFDLCPSAVLAPALSQREVGGRAGAGASSVRGSRSCRVGLRGVSARAPVGAGRARRPRRRLLHVLRGHRSLPAHPGRGPRSALRTRGNGFAHEGGGSAPRASLLPVLAASRLHYAEKHWSRPAAVLERTGVALEALTRIAVSRGGRAARAGHARALLVALTRSARS